MAYTPLKFSTRRGTNPATVPWSKEEGDQLVPIAQRSGGSGTYTSRVGTLAELQTLINDTFANVDGYTGQEIGRMVYVSDAFGSGEPGIAVFTSSTAYEVFAPARYDLGMYYPGNPADTVTNLQKIIVAQPILFDSDFAGSYGDVDVNPAATYTMTVKDDGANIGTISISTGGVFSFLTNPSGSTIEVAAGSVITIEAPAASPSDTTIEGIGVTLKALVNMTG